MKRFLLFTIVNMLVVIGSARIIMTFDDPTIYSYAKPNAGNVTQIANGGTLSLNPINLTAAFTSGSGLRFYANTSTGVVNLRVYKDASFIIATTDGSKISSIVFEGSNLGSSYISATGYDGTDTWSGSETSVTFNCIKSTVQINKVTITTAAAGALATPTFKPAAGEYYGPQTITLSGPTDAKIFYSTDNTNFTEYTEPFVLNASATVYAYSRKGDTASETVSATYSMKFTTGELPVMPSVITLDEPIIRMNGDRPEYIKFVGTDTQDNFKYTLETYDSEAHFQLTIEPADAQQGGAFPEGIASNENYWEPLFRQYTQQLAGEAMEASRNIKKLYVTNVALLPYQFAGYCDAMKEVYITTNGDYTIPAGCFSKSNSKNYGIKTLECKVEGNLTIGENAVDYEAGGLNIYTYNENIAQTWYDYKNRHNCAYSTYLNGSEYIGRSEIVVGNLKYMEIDATSLCITGTNGPISGALDIPSLVEYGGKTYTVKKVDASAFYNCTGLTAITIPNSINDIGKYAFKGCTGLISVSIPNSITSINNYTFEGCEKLTTITIPNSVMSIGYDAFSGCIGLTSVTIGNSVTSIGNGAFNNCFGLTSVTIPNSVTSIGSSAFSGCSGLTSVTIPNFVKTIGDYAFYNCIGLTSVTIPNSVTAIGNNVFSGCGGLNSVTIPNSVTTIGDNAFSGCGGLNSLTIPNSVTAIGNNAFYGCSGLTSVTIGKSVTNIGNNAFYGCSSLETVIIPNSVISIGKESFYGCSGLMSVTIGNSVTEIGQSAFYGCNNLKSVISEITGPFSIVNNVFPIDTYSSATLTVPDGCINKYKNTAGWNLFQNIQEKSNQETPDNPDDPIIDKNNTLILSDAQVPCGNDIVLPILMNNEADITAIQLDLYLPSGFSVAKDEDDEWLVDIGSRTTLKKHSISCQQQVDGSLRIVCGSQKNALFSGNEGDLLNVTIHVDKNVADGDYTIEMRNIVLATPESQRFITERVQGKITVFSFIPGDVNNDGSIDVADLPALVSFILNSSTDGFIFKAADLNEDGVILVDDYVSLVNMILGGAKAKSFKPQFSQKDADGLGISVDAFSIKPGEKKEIAINMNNPGDEFTAVQLDLVLPAGISVAKEDDEWMVDVGSRTTLKKHSISGEPQTDGSFRIVCGSQSNKVFSGESGSIILVTLQADANATEGITEMTLKNIVLARTNSTSEKLDPVNVPVTIGNTDGINGARIIGDSKAYYDLQGRKVEHPSKGIYIHGGKKVLIK